MDIGRRHGAWLVALCSVASLCAAGGADNRAELIDAVRLGNRAAAAALLRQPGRVNTPEADGTTALHWAVRADDQEMVQLLLRAGADVKAANRYGVQPLALAAVNGNASIIELLLQAGADPNAALPEAGETVLMTAARTGRVEALQVLLAHGATVNTREGEFGETALMWAAVENHAAAVQMLIDNGADKDARSATVPQTARAGRGGPEGQWTPLMYAARQGALAAARTLADAGADLNATAPGGTTALVLAIINDHYDLGAMLLEKGADPNIADSTGMAALYAAVDMHTLTAYIGRPEPKLPDQLDSLDMVRLLLARGANPNARLKTRKPPRGQSGGDPSLGEGTTPLMRAAKTGDVVMMRLLLEHGADPNARQKNGTTLFMIASGMGWKGGFETNRDRGTEAGAIEAMKLCLELGADINAVNDDGQTALHGAIGRGESVLEFLAKQGANLQARDNRGRTPLDLAISTRDFDIDTDHVGPEVRRLAVVVLQRLMGLPPTLADQAGQVLSKPSPQVLGSAK
jgi:ankyrin repeat protein